MTETRTPPNGEPDKRTSREMTRVRTITRATRDVRQAISTGKDRAELAWRPDGQYLISDNYEELPDQCAWEPPILAYRLPIEDGTTWNVDSTCTSGPVSVHRTEQARVTGKKSVQVANLDVDVWVVDRTGRTKYSTAERMIEIGTAGTDLFAPRHGLVVRSTVKKTTTTAGGSTLVSTTERQLQNLSASESG